MKNEIINLLSTDSYLVVNKVLVKKIGLTETILLSELCSEYNYYKDSGELEEDGSFFSTIENVEKNTTLSKDLQNKALQTLETNNIIERGVKGLPAKRYFKINEDILRKILLGEITPSSCRKSRKQGFVKTATNNNSISNSSKSNVSSNLEETNSSNSYDSSNNYETNTIHSSKLLLEEQQKQWFQQWWSEYPKKQDKKNAEKKFYRIVKDEITFNTLLLGIRRTVIPQSKAEGNQYVPMPSTWLNGERWNDEPYKPKKKDGLLF